MVNHLFLWAIFNSYVSLPEGTIEVPSGKLTPLWKNTIFNGKNPL